MSFDFNNSINSNLSNVQASSKTTDGGGGNTGYFQRNQDEEEKNMLEFAKDYPEDSFEHVEISDISLEENDESISSLLKKIFSKIFEKIKNIFKK